MSHKIPNTEFFAMVDRLAGLDVKGENPQWFPTIAEIDELIVPEMKKNRKMLEFALWLSEREPPKNLPPQKANHFIETRKHLRKILSNYIKVTDAKETEQQ